MLFVTDLSATESYKFCDTNSAASLLVHVNTEVPVISNQFNYII